MIPINRKRKWRLIAYFIVGWTLAFVFLTIVRGIGTTEEGSVQFETSRSLLLSVFFGVFFGSISGYAQLLTEDRLYKRIPLSKFLLIRLFYALLFLLSMVLISYAVVTQVWGVQISLSDFFVEPGSFPVYFYILFTDLTFVFLRQINLMVGEGNLLKLIRGQFYTPREEERIFLFLDLKGSTRAAEQLGHLRYSSLLQDCFDDLAVVADLDAEIYQYVGDEVILTWQREQGLKNQHCLQAYFRFMDRLQARSVYYKQEYGNKPFFKAGAHVGTVAVTEVGRYKREIAYHGDTINTAARLQAQCTRLHQPLLISGELGSALKADGVELEHMGETELRGKQKAVEMYGVRGLTWPADQPVEFYKFEL